MGCPWVGHNEINEDMNGKFIEMYLQPFLAQKLIFLEYFK